MWHTLRKYKCIVFFLSGDFYMKYFLLVMLAVCTLTAAAAEGSGERESSERSRGRGRGMMGGRRGGNFMEQMKNKYPKEYAEIEKLRESDPEKARNKMRDLMRKSMSENGMMPLGRGFAPPPAEPSDEQLKELKAKYSEEFAEYEKLKKSDPEKAKEKLQQLMKKAFGENAAVNDKFLRDRHRRANAFVVKELKRRYPEKMQEIEKLQTTDPDTAREELRKLFTEADLRIPGGQRELNYEYVPPQQQQNNRNWMMNRGGFPFGGGMMGPWGGRR